MGVHPYLRTDRADHRAMDRIQAELVSTIWPSSSSVPTATTSQRMYGPPERSRVAVCRHSSRRSRWVVWGSATPSIRRGARPAPAPLRQLADLEAVRLRHRGLGALEHVGDQALVVGQGSPHGSRRGGYPACP